MDEHSMSKEIGKKEKENTKKRKPTGKIWTTAKKEDFEDICKTLGGELDPVLEFEKKGQLSSCRLKLPNNKILHLRYKKGLIITFETEFPITDPRHFLKKQEPIKEDLDKFLQELKKRGYKFQYREDQ